MRYNDLLCSAFLLECQFCLQRLASVTTLNECQKYSKYILSCGFDILTSIRYKEAIMIHKMAVVTILIEVYWNRLFYFLIRYRNTKDRSKVRFPQLFRCMYVCVCVYVRSTGHTVWRMELKFLPRYLSIFIKRQRLSFWRSSEFWGSYAPFSTF